MSAFSLLLNVLWIVFGGRSIVIGLHGGSANDRHRQMYMVCRATSSGVATRRMIKHPGGAKYGLGLDVPCCQAGV